MGGLRGQSTDQVHTENRRVPIMTVAAFLLECEVCHDKMGLLSGAVASFICFGCAAERVFGDGKPPSPAASSPFAKAPSASEPPPQDDLFFCPSCKTQRVWRLSRPPWP